MFAFAGKCRSVLASLPISAPSIKLTVEVDGGYHARRRTADANRDRKLARLGYRVVRISAELVLSDLAAAVALVGAAL